MCYTVAHFSFDEIHYHLLKIDYIIKKEQKVVKALLDAYPIFNRNLLADAEKILYFLVLD